MVCSSVTVLEVHVGVALILVDTFGDVFLSLVFEGWLSVFVRRKW